ncbi:hypothetical protein HY251_01930 [bacterium]|nr:hypothetical protein [bacterium]
MRLRNFSLVLALGLGLAAPMLGRPGPAAVANDEVWQEGYIILTDGTRLDGEIKVGQTKVSYRKKGATVSRDYDFTEIANDKDNKKEIHPVEAGDKAGGKSKLVEIVTTGGNTYRGMGQEQPNGDWKIKVGGKELLVKKNEIKEVRDIEDDSAADPDRYVDFDCRFILERPAKDWKIHHGTSPTVRAQAAFNNGKDESGFVRVSVRPFPQAASSLYDMAHADAAKLKTEVEAELKKEFEKVAAVEVVVAELFGCPVYEVRYEGNYASEATFKCVELRFVRENLLYAITGGCDKTIWKPPLEQKLRDAFASFSWLAAIGGDEDTYTDTALGFAIDRPSAKWTIIGRPFSGESPVTIKKQDDAGEIKSAPTRRSTITRESSRRSGST